MFDDYGKITFSYVLKDSVEITHTISGDSQSYEVIQVFESFMKSVGYNMDENEVTNRLMVDKEPS